MPLSPRARAAWEKQQREALRTWTIRVMLPADAVNPGRYMARVLKALGRQYRIRCVAILENDPTVEVSS
jgi:hypothetical protein